jgi:hypothetical protein
MKHCENNINFYHHKNTKSQKDIIMEVFNIQMEKRIGKTIREYVATTGKEEQITTQTHNKNNQIE